MKRPGALNGCTINIPLKRLKSKYSRTIWNPGPVDLDEKKYSLLKSK
jgi:hypothetical protein